MEVATERVWEKQSRRRMGVAGREVDGRSKVEVEWGKRGMEGAGRNKNGSSRTEVDGSHKM